jgi:hypothetical protein
MGRPWHGEETLHRILGKICTFRSANRRLNSGRITLPRVRSRAQALGRALATLCVRATHGRLLSPVPAPSHARGCLLVPRVRNGLPFTPPLASSKNSNSGELSSARHHCSSLGHRGQLPPAASKPRQLLVASPVARETFQVLGPGRASPETQDRPRRTWVACSHA